MLHKIALAMLLSVLGVTVAGAQVESSLKIDDGPSGGLPDSTLQNSDLFGVSVTPIDVDGDGTWKLAVGAERDGDAGRDRKNQGAVWILTLDEKGKVKETPRKIDGTEGFPEDGLKEKDLFGSSVASIDINGDGKQKLVVGAKSLEEPGAVWILTLDADGKVTGTLRIADGVGGLPAGSLQGGDFFGSSVAAIDVDGDGRRQELAVGAPGDDGKKGAVWILTLDDDGKVMGDPRKILAADVELTGEDQYFFGLSVAAIDVDGDGRQELAVGVPGESRGTLRILFFDPQGMVDPDRMVRITRQGGGGFLA